MTRNYLKVSLRNLARNRTYAIINILGLTIGITSVLLISLYTQRELSYDNFFAHSDRTYRVALQRIYPNRERYFASSSAVLADVLNENYAEVEAATRLHRMFFVREMPVKVEDETFREPRFYFADKDYFKVFSHEFVYGNPETALDATENVVLSQSTAEKYFGDVDPTGKIIMIDTFSLKVTGVFKDIPVNSHIHFDLLSNIMQVGYLEQAIETNNWINPWLYTYIRLREGVDPKEFEAKLPALVDQYGKASIARALGENYKEEGHQFNYFLQPIEDIHLHSNLDVEVEANSDIKYVYMLIVIAGIILVISTINFVNLSTARSADRAREVGVRKVMGSVRQNLINQFLSESVLIALIGAILALGITYYLLPVFNNLLGIQLTMSTLLNPVAIALFVVFVVLVGVLAGLYPAFAISSLQPSEVLKGSYKTSGRGVWLRNVLIIFQFFMAIVMISGAITVNQQMRFLQNKDLGFTKDDVIVIKEAQNLGDNSEAFKNEIRSLSGVESLGAAFAMPGDFLGSAVMNSPDAPDIQDFRANTVTVDPDFMKTMEFELVAGRGYGNDGTDSAKVIINEAAVQAMNLDDPVGMRIQNTGVNNANRPNIIYEIVGVVKDYNFLSLHSPITPLVIFRSPDQFIAPVIAIRANTDDVSGIIEKIKGTWEKHSEDPFTFSFLQDDLNKQYEADQRAGNIFDVFTYIAILMSCIGLFGLSTYIVQQRVKEMSIRKVLGASSLNIVFVFVKSFISLIGIALLVGIPVSYYLINRWLEGFAFHVDVTTLIFLVATVTILGLVLVTISYQSVRLSRVNPVDTIRTE